MLITVINGPNLNLLGSREPEIYGRQTLADIEQAVTRHGKTLGVDVAWHQTNSEGVFVDLIQGMSGTSEGAVINAAAFTHTSLAIRDALLAVKLPFVEVHLSNVFARERRRRHSHLADLAVGVIAGLGAPGYRFALEAIVDHIRQ